MRAARTRFFKRSEPGQRYPLATNDRARDLVKHTVDRGGRSLPIAVQPCSDRVDQLALVHPDPPFSLMLCCRALDGDRRSVLAAGVSPATTRELPPSKSRDAPPGGKNLGARRSRTPWRGWGLTTGGRLCHGRGMREAFAHDATVQLACGGDDAAPGAAITLALCGRWDHEPPCPLAPHHTSVERTAEEPQLRILFAVGPHLEGSPRTNRDGVDKIATYPARWRRDNVATPH